MTDLTAPRMGLIEQIDVPDFSTRTNGNAVGEDIKGVVDAVGAGLASDRVTAFQEETIEVEDNFNRLVTTQEALNEIEVNKYSPEVGEMDKQLRRLSLLGSQKPIDTTVMMVMKENVFRKYAARYPSLIPQFLEAAKQSGLSSNGVALETQYKVDDYNAKIADAQTAREGLNKKMEENEYFAENYPSGTWEEAAAAYLKYANYKNVWELQDLRSKMQNLDKADRADYVGRQVDEAWVTAEQERGYNQLLSAFRPLDQLYLNSDEAIAAQDVNAIPNTLRATKVAVERVLVNLEAQLDQPYTDAGLDPSDPAIVAKKNARMAPLRKLAEDILATASPAEGRAAVQFMREAMEYSARNKLGITFEMIEALKIGKLGKEGGVLADETARLVTGTAVTNTLNNYSQWDAARSIVSGPESAGDGSYTGITDVRTGDNATQGPADAKTIKDLGEAQKYLTSEQPDTQKRALNWTMAKLAGMDKAYRKNVGAPSEELVDGFMRALTDPKVYAYINGPDADWDTVQNYKVSLQNIAGYELGIIGRETAKAYKDLRKVDASGSRPMTGAEQADIMEFSIRTGGGEGGGMVNIPPGAKVKDQASSVVWIETDNRSNVTFKTNDPAAADAVAKLNASPAVTRASRFVRAVSMALDVTPESALNTMITTSGYNFPSSFVKKQDQESKGANE